MNEKIFKTIVSGEMQIKLPSDPDTHPSKADIPEIANSHIFVCKRVKWRNFRKKVIVYYKLKLYLHFDQIMPFLDT